MLNCKNMCGEAISDVTICEETLSNLLSPCVKKFTGGEKTTINR